MGLVSIVTHEVHFGGAIKSSLTGSWGVLQVLV